MRIKVLESPNEVKPDYLSYLQDYGHSLIHYDESCDPSTIDAIVVRFKTQVNNALLDIYSNIRCVCRVGVGTDTIDMKALEERNIQLFTTPGANARAVADLTLGCIISLLRPYNHQWNDFSDRKDCIGDDLASQQIGLVGYGNIGQKVFNRLLGFEVENILVYDPSKQKLYNNNQLSVPDSTKISFVDTIEDMLPYVDILSLHVPGSERTKNLINATSLSLMKNNSKIINFSRGDIIDEEALIDFLQKNPGSSAHLDTWQGEPNMPNQGLRSLKNCTITPHIGTMTNQALEAMHKFPSLIQ